jgi:hypothetical protein
VPSNPGDVQLCLSTSAGSIRDARRAGSQPAKAPTAASAIADPTSVAGSPGSRPYRSDATNVDAQTLMAAPTSTPRPTNPDTRASTICTTSAGAAPSAMRMPISVRRRATAYAVTPYNPSHASSSATALKNPERIASTRSAAIDSSTCCASGSNESVKSSLIPVRAASTVRATRAGESIDDRTPM